MDTTATTAPTFRTILRDEAPEHVENALLMVISNVHSELQSTNESAERAALDLARNATRIAEGLAQGHHTACSPTQDATRLSELLVRRDAQNRSLAELLFVLQDEELRTRLRAAR